MKNKLKTNIGTWDKVAPLFSGICALPAWGPFDIGKNKKLIGEIKDKTFLEMGCGSGHSIKYLIRVGAKKVFGLDASPRQIEYARELNKKAVEKEKVRLFNSPMEKPIRIQKVDTVFSVYAIGWSLSPKKLFKIIYSYLKPGGLFVWSWDHPLFRDIYYKNGKLVYQGNYHKEGQRYIKAWKKQGDVYIQFKKISTWFSYLREAGFEIVEYLEPKPTNLTKENKDSPKYYSPEKAARVPSTFIFKCRKPLKS